MDETRRTLLTTGAGAAAVAAAAAPRAFAQQPAGTGPFYENGNVRIRYQDTGGNQSNIKGWGPELVKRRPDITMDTVDRFLTSMYRNNSDFVFSVTRDFVRSCETPVLVLPDDSPPHPYVVAMETVMLAPKSEVSIFPWKDPKDRIPIAVRQVRSFMRAHRPVTA